MDNRLTLAALHMFARLAIQSLIWFSAWTRAPDTPIWYPCNNSRLMGPRRLMRNGLSMTGFPVSRPRRRPTLFVTLANRSGDRK